MSKKLLSFTVNGKKQEIYIEPNTTLLSILRDDLDLTGTKCVCAVGECGACTVLIDGVPKLSCSTLAMNVKGRSVVTIEGLMEYQSLHPIQQKFVEHGAIQCGYCTPGMILTAKALIDENPHPTREEVKEYMAGNLCRCTGYVKIIDAVLAAAEMIARGESGSKPWDLNKDSLKGVIVSQRINQPEAVSKAIGSAKYVSDMKISGMLIGKVLRSPHPHARVVKIDKSKAEKVPGVEIVIGPDDIEEWNGYDRGLKDLPMIAGGYTVPPDEKVLNKRARHFGDAVAAVAAVNEQAAEEALGLIEVTYEKLPFVLDVDKAIQEDAPFISEYAEQNIGKHIDYTYPEGDVEAAFKESDCVVEGTFSTSKQEHCTEETAAALAQMDLEGRLTVWSQCQLAHMARREICHIFNIPIRKVRVVTPITGGSFGQRGALCAEPICIALAIKTGKPVKVVYTREENFIGLESRTPFNYTVKMGFRKDGTLTSIKTYMKGQLGGYMGCGPMASGIGMIMGLGHYRCPNRAGASDMVMTNIPVSGAMRGFGNPAIMWGIEQLMDDAAQKLGLTPIEIRLKNIKEKGEIANMGLPIESIYLKDCIAEGSKAIDWHEKHGKSKNKGRIRRGVGMATMGHCTGAAPLYIDHSNAVIKFNEDGSADLIVHPAQVGQHIWGALTQIAAQELGLEIDDIKIVTGDTDVTLFEYGSDASRSTYAIGNATLLSARRAKNQLLAHASKMLNHPQDDMEIKSRLIYSKSDPTKSISIGDICNNGIYNFHGHAKHFVGQCSWESKWNSPPTGAYFAEVEVDTETGEVSVLKFVTAIDCGTAINPNAVEGQIEGAIQQGIGYTLTEDYLIDQKTGEVLTDNYDSYKMPGSMDMPKTNTVIIIDKPDPKGPFGAKGVGEAGMVGVAPAIGNAIYDAIGIRIKDLPITPEKVLEALRNYS